MELVFTIPGRPYGKKRPRFGGGRAYNPKENREYERLVAFSFKSAAIRARIPAFPPPFGKKAVGIRITACYPIPKSVRKQDREKMDGEPVYMIDLTGGTLWNQWIIFQKSTDDGFIPRGGGFFGKETYGKTWLAYRRKPEKGEKTNAG